MYNPSKEIKDSYFIKYMSDNLCNSYFDSFFEEDDELLESNLKPQETLIQETTTNCLALTIKKDYKLASWVNVITRSFRMTFKVLVSYFALNIIKLFF